MQVYKKFSYYAKIVESLQADVAHAAFFKHGSLLLCRTSEHIRPFDNHLSIGLKRESEDLIVLPVEHSATFRVLFCGHFRHFVKRSHTRM